MSAAPAPGETTVVISWESEFGIGNLCNLAGLLLKVGIRAQISKKVSNYMHACIMCLCGHAAVHVAMFWPRKRSSMLLASSSGFRILHKQWAHLLGPSDTRAGGLEVRKLNHCSPNVRN